MASADRLIEVFTEAKARPAGAERERFLAGACPDEPALKAQVLALLEAHEGAGDFLSQTQLISPVSLLTEKPGDRIGRYKLLQQIGEGGCGVVYMAEQEEPVRRRVALKVIKLGMDTKSVVARFDAERQALALMDHPNIAKVLEAGATETGRPYFVMELVRGIKITDFCDEHSLSTGDRLKLFVQVCQAIQHAHQKGIIHRDIKPSNILVTINDGVPVPKVIDFGIAKATQGRLTDHTLFTAFEQFIGTPAYMSPEQAVMTSLDIDTRSDIYSLGVLLYELLTGKTPFDQQELLAAGLDEMRRTIREKEPLRPSTRLSAMDADALTTTAKRCHTDAPKLLHAVQGDLDWIVMKCLEKDRARRYETANGVATDILRHLNCEPVVARPPSRLYEFQKTVRRHKVGFAAAAALITVLAVGALVSTWQAVRARREQRIAKQERDHAVRAEADAQQQKIRAQAEARNAAVQLADSLINQADALTTAHEFPAAYARYSEAEGQLQRLGSPLARLDLSLVRLYRASPPPLWTRNIPDYMIGMVLLPSRKEVIAACGDGKFYALDLMSGAVNRTFGGPSAVRGLASANTPEGPVLIAGGPGLVQLIDPLSGAVIRQADDDRAAKFCVVSPDGSLAASGNDSGTVTIWETATCKKLGGGKQVARGRQGAQISTAAFSHDGATIAIVSDGIAFWDARTGQQIRHIPAPYSTSLAFTADDRALVCGEDIGFISVITLEGKSLARWLVCQSNNGIKSLFVTPEGNRVITTSADGEVRVFDNSFGGGWTPTLTMATDKSSMLEALYVPDAGPKSCGATSGLSAADRGVVIALTLHDVFSWPLLAPDRFSDRLDGAISISPDGLLCAGQFPGRVEVRDLATGRTLRSLPQPVNIRATTFSRDSGQLYVGDDDGVLRAFDLLRGEYTWTVQGHNAPICSIDVSLDGALVASASEDGTARAWDARTGALLDTMHHRGGYGTAAIFVPAVVSGKPAALVGGPSPGAQRMIVCAGQDGSIYDWDISHHSYPRPAYVIGATHGLTLSPDRKLVAASSVAHRANLLDAATLAQVGSLGPIPSGMDQVCFIDNAAGPGAWALACGGRELRVFEMASGRERLVLDSTLDDLAVTSTYTGTYYPNSMAASPDGAIVVAKGAGRISFTLPRLYRELLRAPSPLKQTDFYSEWGVWAWVRELLERERAAGRDGPPLLLARANWMCGDYESARRGFDLAVATHATPAWYAALCSSVGDNPPTAAPLPPTPRPKDTLEQLPAAEPLREGVLAAAELPVLTSLIGKEVVVEGVVSDSAWSRSGKVMNIRFAGVEEGKLGLSSCLFLKDRAAFDSAFGGDAANAFSGTRLRIRGALAHYGGFDYSLKGQPQMILTNPLQVTIVQRRPVQGQLPVPLSASGYQSREAEAALPGAKLAFDHTVRLQGEGKLAEAATTAREAAQICHSALAHYEILASDPNRHHDAWSFAVAYEAIASLLKEMSQPQAAETAYRDAQVLWRKLVADANTEDYRFHLAVNYDALGNLLKDTGRPAESLEAFRGAQAIWLQLVAAFNLEDRRMHLGYTDDDIGQLLTKAGRLNEAIEAYREALAVWRKLVAEFNKDDYRARLSGTLVSLATTLQTAGKTTEAEPLFREAAEHADAQTLNEMAWRLATAPDTKLRDGSNAVSYAEKAVATTNRKNVSYLDTLAAAYAETGQFARAISVQQEAIALSQSEPEKKDLASKLKLYENNSPYRDHGSLAELARNRLLEGKFAEAERLARECLAIRETEIPDDWRTFNARSTLGGALLGQQKYAEAEPWLLSGYDGMRQRQDQIPAAGIPRVTEALQRLVQLYEATGRPEEASKWKQKLVSVNGAANAERKAPETPKP